MTELNTTCDRRAFLHKMGGWSLGLLLGSMAAQQVLSASEFQSPGFTRAPLPNACMTPEGETEQILAEVVNTIVPGAEIDPTGAPGGLDACAVNMLLDGNYPFKEQAAALATLMDLTAKGEYQKTFLECSYDQRLQVLLQAELSMPLLTMAYRAIRSAFFGGAYNGVGLDYMKYPGPNLGYRHIEECSFRRAVCQEMTKDGWMP